MSAKILFCLAFCVSAISIALCQYNYYGGGGSPYYGGGHYYDPYYQHDPYYGRPVHSRGYYDNYYDDYQPRRGGSRRRGGGGGGRYSQFSMTLCLKNLRSGTDVFITSKAYEHFILHTLEKI